jgi:hypothetical protein
LFNPSGFKLSVATAEEGATMLLSQVLLDFPKYKAQIKMTALFLYCEENKTLGSFPMLALAA